MPVYSQTTTLGWKQEASISVTRAEAYCSQGIMRRVVNEAGKHIGYQHYISEPQSSDIPGFTSPPAITAREMQIFAGQHFLRGGSRTVGLIEDDRLNRTNQKTGQHLPEEDAVERVVAKVAAWKGTRHVPATS
jgi:hypothetical protein